MYYIYIIRCEDDSLYTGITTDLERRFGEHRKKTEKCAKYTYFHGAAFLECAWKCENRSQASKLEYLIKKLNKKTKERLIRGEIDINDIITFDKSIDYEIVKRGEYLT